MKNARLTPEGAGIRNPAFDVTPHHLVAGIITERGISRAPYHARTVPRPWRTRELTSCSASRPPATRQPPPWLPRPSTPRTPWRVRSNVVASQVDIHREWGGVVPELASRQHVRDICGVVERALSDATPRSTISAPSPSRRARGWSGRSWWAWPSRSRWRSRGRCRSCRAPSRGTHRVALPAERPAAAAGRRAGRVRRSHEPYLVDRPGTTSCSAARVTMQRGRRTTRWPSCSDSVYPGRARDRRARRKLGDDRALPRPGSFVSRTRTRRAHDPGDPGRLDFSF